MARRALLGGLTLLGVALGAYACSSEHQACIFGSTSSTEVLPASLSSAPLGADCHAACVALYAAEQKQLDDYSASLCSFVSGYPASSPSDPAVVVDGGPAVICDEAPPFPLPSGFSPDGGSSCHALCLDIAADGGSFGPRVIPNSGISDCSFTTFSDLHNWDAGTVSDGGPGVSCTTSMCNIK